MLIIFSSPADLQLGLFGAFATQSRNEKTLGDSHLDKEVEGYKKELENYQETIDELRAELRRVVPANPIWRGRDFETNKSLCFVLLPFKDEYFELYESAIQPAVEAAGLSAQHAGEIFGNREIVEDIWESICKARLIIADVTGRNPNVFYELGIAHTLGKESIVILTTIHILR